MSTGKFGVDGQRAEVVLVTGTGTDVGKTVATAALAVLAAAGGRAVAVVKPVQTGVRDGQAGDAAIAAALAGQAEGFEFTRLPEPLAPDIAARRAGRRLDPVATVADRIRALAGQFDVVLVEGAGGLLVRLDSDGGTLVDLATHLPGASIVVVVNAGLGTLNHSELTVEALRHRGLTADGLIVGSWPRRPGVAEQENLTALPQVTQIPVLGAVPEGAGQLDPAAFAALVHRTVAPWKGPGRPDQQAARKPARI